MKLLAMKLVSLLVLVAGVVALCIAFNVPQVQQPYDQFRDALMTNMGDPLNVKLLIFGAVLTVLGFYSLIPAFPDNARKRTITYAGDHGEIDIRLDQAEYTINQVLRKMPEVQSVRVSVKPDQDHKQAIITADAVVYNQEDQPAKQTYEMLAHLIEETATDVLGLDIQQPIHLRVRGTKLKNKKTSQALHEKVARLSAQEQALRASGAAPASRSAAAGAGYAAGALAAESIPSIIESDSGSWEPATSTAAPPIAIQEEVYSSSVSPSLPSTGPAAIQTALGSSSFENEPSLDVHDVPLHAEEPLEPLSAEDENYLRDVPEPPMAHGFIATPDEDDSNFTVPEEADDKVERAIYDSPAATVDIDNEPDVQDEIASFDQQTETPTNDADLTPKAWEDAPAPPPVDEPEKPKSRWSF